MPASHRSTSSYRHPDVRDLHADEAYVLGTYQDHAKCCARCANPLESTDLCSRGTPLAENVVKYLCRREGQFYARRSHPDDKTDKIRLPPHAFSVRWLLAAVEQGLHLNTTGGGDPQTTTPDSPSIRIIEPRPQQSTPTSYFQIRPFCTRKKHLYSQCPLYTQLSSVGPSGLRVDVKYKSRRSTVAVELKFYSNL